VAKRAPRLPCYTQRNRRERNPHFFGRENVFAQIDDALLPEPHTVGGAGAPNDHGKATLKSFALCGIGGCGKTEIAVEYAYRREESFDAIFWITADDRDILTEEFAHIAVALGLLQEQEAGDLLTACDLVKGWLSNPVKSHEAVSSPDNEAKWLLVFDNADHQDILDEFWPTTALGSIMVTSRDTYAKSQTYTANNGVDMTPFTLQEAEDMIKQLLPTETIHGQEPYIAEIAEKLGGLPLLLTQMSGVMNRLHLSCKDFLRLFEERDIEHLDWVGDESSRSAQIFKISTNLGLDGLSPGSLGLLQMASLLDPDCIPEDVLTHAINGEGIAGFPTNFKDFFNARMELQKSSLAVLNRTTGDLTLHRIVQDVTLASMSPTRRRDIVRATLQAVSAAWPYVELKDRFTTDRYPACAKIFPSVVRLKQVLVDEDQDADTVAKLLNDAGWYLSSEQPHRFVLPVADKIQVLVRERVPAGSKRLLAADRTDVRPIEWQVVGTKAIHVETRKSRLRYCEYGSQRRPGLPEALQSVD
jgi:hypothetical protein